MIGHAMRLIGTAAIVAGLGVLLYVGLVVARARAVGPPPASAPSAATATEAPVVRRVLVTGELLGQIRIERLEVTANIREGETDAVLRDGVGHLSDTSWIGQGGHVALAGHRDTVFRGLRDVKTGDVIEIATPDGTTRYLVEHTSVVTPDDLSVLEPTGGSTLTLVTCYPFTYIGPAPNRFIVRAREISHPALQ